MKNKKLNILFSTLAFLSLSATAICFVEWNHIEHIDKSINIKHGLSKYYIDSCDISDNIINIAGWAVVDGDYNRFKGNTYVVVEDAKTKKTYKVKTQRIDRPDVGVALGSVDKYRTSGFQASSILPMKNMSAEFYVVSEMDGVKYANQFECK